MAWRADYRNESGLVKRGRFPTQPTGPALIHVSADSSATPTILRVIALSSTIRTVGLSMAIRACYFRRVFVLKAATPFSLPLVANIRPPALAACGSRAAWEHSHR